MNDKTAKTIMVQGTASSAGKSVIVAAFLGTFAVTVLIFTMAFFVREY